jgi:hypothetical protein
MATLHLHVKDSILEKVLGLLAQFDKSEVEVMGEDAAFIAQKKHLHEQMELYKRGELKTYTVEEVEAHMDKVISEYED